MIRTKAAVNSDIDSLKELIKQHQAGNADATEQCIERLIPLVNKTARMLCSKWNCLHRVDDIASTGFIVIHKALDAVKLEIANPVYYIRMYLQEYMMMEIRAGNFAVKMPRRLLDNICNKGKNDDNKAKNSRKIKSHEFYQDGVGDISFDNQALMSMDCVHGSKLEELMNSEAEDFHNKFEARTQLSDAIAEALREDLLDKEDIEFLMYRVNLDGDTKRSWREVGEKFNLNHDQCTKAYNNIIAIIREYIEK